MTDQPKLKPCPFCKSADITIVEGSIRTDDVNVICLGCGAGCKSAPESEAIAAWNRRSYRLEDMPPFPGVTRLGAVAMSDLKPCPFCGQTDGVIRPDDTVNCIACRWCDAEVIAPSEAETVARWNTRPSPWIPVGERMPEFAVNDGWPGSVLAVIEGRPTPELVSPPRSTDSLYWYSREAECCWYDTRGQPETRDASGFVTHWMLLPEVP